MYRNLLCTEVIMEPAHIFIRNYLLTKKNIFATNIAEEFEVEEVRFKKSKKYAITSLSINQDIDSSLVAVTDTDRQEAITN